MLYLLGFLILIGLLIFLLKPRMGRVDFGPFLGWDYAHRVFYDNSGAAPENSLSARDQLSGQLHRSFYGGILQSPGCRLF